MPWTGESRGASAASAEEVALRGRLSAELERALAAIPERQRQALLLAELHGLTGLELAEALGVSHVAARALLTRARESLRQALAVERARAGVSDAAGRDQAAAGTGGRKAGARGGEARVMTSSRPAGAPRAGRHARLGTPRPLAGADVRAA